MSILVQRPYEVGLAGGYSDRYAPGSGQSRPPGVESVLEYNGALLNVRDWYDTYLITSIDGLADPDVRDAREVNPGRHGETYFNAYYGGRTIVLSGKIRAHSLAKMRDMQMALKMIFSDISVERPLLFRTGDSTRDVMIYCKKSQPIVMAEIQQNFNYEREFQITLRASNPRFLSYLENQQQWSVLPGFSETFDTMLQTTGENRIEEGTFLFNPAVWGWAERSGAPSPRTTNVSISHDLAAPWVAHGNSALKIMGTWNDNSTSGPSTATGAISQQFTVTPGESIRVKYQFKINKSSYYSGRWRTFIRWRHSNGTTTDSAVVQSSTSMVGGGARPAETVNAVFTVPAGVIDARVHFGIDDVSPYAYLGEQWEYYVDAFQVTLASYDGEFINGNDAFGIWAGGEYTSRSSKILVTGLEGKYSFDAGEGYMWSDGDLRLHSSSVMLRTMWRSDQPFKFKDVTAVMKYTATGTLARPRFGHRLKRLNSVNYLLACTELVGSANQLRFYVVNNGTLTAVGAASSTFTLPSGSYWMRVLQTGNLLTLQHWTTDPALGGSPTQQITHTLSGADATKFGTGVEGDVGIYIDPNNGNVSGSLKINEHKIEGSGSGLVNLIFKASNKGSTAALPIFRITGPLSAAASGGPALTLRSTVLLPTGESKTQKMTINAKVGSTLAIPSGSYIEIDADKRTLKEYTNAGVFTRNSYDQLDVNSDWLEILPGDNPIEAELTSAQSMNITMRFRDSFL